MTLQRSVSEMARRQSSPFTGKRSAGPDSTWAGFSTLEGAFATIPSPPLRNALAKKNGAPRLRFLRHRGIFQSDVGLSSNPSLGWNRCLPPAAPDPSSRTRREEHALLIVQMSSGRLFLDRVGRHQSPSPLRRHAQTNTHFPSHHSKPERSTLLGRGTFYFALTACRAALPCSDLLYPRSARLPGAAHPRDFSAANAASNPDKI